MSETPPSAFVIHFWIISPIFAAIIAVRAPATNDLTHCSDSGNFFEHAEQCSGFLVRNGPGGLCTRWIWSSSKVAAGRSSRSDCPRRRLRSMVDALDQL